MVNLTVWGLASALLGAIVVPVTTKGTRRARRGLTHGAWGAIGWSAAAMERPLGS